MSGYYVLVWVLPIVNVWVVTARRMYVGRAERGYRPERHCRLRRSSPGLLARGRGIRWGSSRARSSRRASCQDFHHCGHPAGRHGTGLCQRVLVRGPYRHADRNSFADSLSYGNSHTHTHTHADARAVHAEADAQAIKAHPQAIAHPTERQAVAGQVGFVTARHRRLT